MKIKDVMTDAVEFVHPKDSVRKAAQKMERINVGEIPILDDDLEAVGILTDRDIAVRLVAAGMDPDQTTVDKIMTRSPIFCREDDPVQTAAELMKEHQVRRLLVHDEVGKFAGVVSLGDFALKAKEALSADILKEVSKGLEEKS
jgi:CBS domain-containing protein